jgi:general L-amino acid transport system substrate-binding protein
MTPGAIAAALCTGLLWTASASAGTLENVRNRGFLECGVNEGLGGFSVTDEQNNWVGFGVDFCRAVAAGIFGDPKAVKFTPLTAKQRFAALQAGEVDMLSPGTTWTMARDTSLGLSFAGIAYYDGQGFMVSPSAIKRRTGLDIASARDLNGSSICVMTGTTTELNLADFFRSYNLTYEVVAFEKREEVLKAYQEGRCDAYTSDRIALFAARQNLVDSTQHVILPEVISKEPLGPVVRQGDDRWFSVVKWTLFALLDAEELGVAKANVDEKLTSKDPAVRRLLGAEGDFGKELGLENDWIVKIIKGTGNYGEIFERNLGGGSKLKIDRGRNKLWSEGGLLFAPPIR